MNKPILLLTRPAASSVRFTMRLDPVVASQADLLISPLLEIVPLNVPIDLTGYAGAIFSSTHGVMQAPQGGGRPAYCVGHQTAAAAAKKGWRVGQNGLDADALIRQMQRGDIAGPLLHLSGVHQRGDIAETLTKGGVTTDRLAIYDQRQVPLTEAAQTALSGEGRIVLPLFSPRTAAYFIEQAASVTQVSAIAMSNAVAEELDGYPFELVQVLQAPTAVQMVRAVELLLVRDTLP